VLKRHAGQLQTVQYLDETQPGEFATIEGGVAIICDIMMASGNQ
jgi:hypothetical protein